MSEPGAALLRLAARAGIASEYRDIWGQPHAAQEEDLAALLCELGIDVAGLGGAEAAEQALAKLASGRRLPPVCALVAGSGRWPLSLQVARGATPLTWTIMQEDGQVQHGHFQVEPSASTPEAPVIAGAVEAPEAIDTALVTLEVAARLAPGYHRLRIDGFEGETLLIAAPERCYRPPSLQGQSRTWGPALQLYSLRSERNWGIGDFGDLAALLEQWAGLGAGIVGLNPLHALFAHNPAHPSPYSPSSRLQLNVLYIDVEACTDLRDCEAAQALVRSAQFQRRLHSLRASEQVDYLGVAAAKFEVLALLYASFRALHLDKDSERARDFRAFCSERGDALRRHALFEALQAHFFAADSSVWGWPVWPEAYRSPDSEAVLQFERQQADAVEYRQYLQWLADGQLLAVGERSRERGMAVGLYLDLAVSVDRAGSDAWGHADTYALDVSIGAPPDAFNPNGQGWGLPPFKPERLRASGYRLLRQTLAACMRHAGALRIDHVMALMRLFCIPPGKSPREGAYLHYAFDEMLAVVLLESHRHRCMVIGEDLGTVADAVRSAMQRTEMLSYRLLYFERGEGGAFKPPADYPREALVAVSTHDLATLAGWWAGRDLALRQELGLFPERRILDEQWVARAEERARLLLVLRDAALLPAGVSLDPALTPALTPELAAAVHALVARTPSRVMMVQLEDALGVLEQANMPGTVDEHPNWRRKLPLPLAAIAEDVRVKLLAAAVAGERPRPTAPGRAATHQEATVPRATYRLQFHAGFGFDAAVRLLPYLARLGISHVYCSPILRARAGSTHGYDIVAHDQINPELGGAEGFERFCTALREHGMGQLLDMVPNHMGISSENAWWMDVLEHGRASLYAHHFDIDWNPVNPGLQGKVLLPVLSEHYGRVLDSGQLVLHFDAAAGAFCVRYFDHRFPLDPLTLEPLLASAASTLAADTPLQGEAQSLAASLAKLPPRERDDAASVAERARDGALYKRRLAALCREHAELQSAIEHAVAALNREDARDALDALLERQAHRLAYWRLATDEINYRRFFDINDLAALRVEEPAVFEATQSFALELAASGKIDGMRIDHPDGLYDPVAYFARLQEGFARRRGRVLAPRGPEDAPARPLYVVVEKIAASHEDVPLSWPVHGTTGYRFAMLAGGVQVCTASQARIDRIWRAFSGEQRSFDELAYEGKRDIMKNALASELTVLATELARIARLCRDSRDHSYNALREAISEVAACMPVYRTYIAEGPASTQDLRYIDWAVAHARKRSQSADASVFDFVREALLGTAPRGASDEAAARVRRFARRFQQFCSPVAAKGVEDTAFYRYSRLVCLNEVGGEPATFGVTMRAFHGASADRAAHRPHTILATSTHDNKRSEDVRSRIAVLSEVPAAWRAALQRWRRLAQAYKSEVDGRPAPSARDEYLLYQTLLGTLPAGGLDDATLAPFRERIDAYMGKAAREAKLETSWSKPHEDYERALGDFVHGLLAHVRPNPFLSDMQQEAERLARFGAFNSLQSVLLKFTSPGVPDLYQGNELMDLSLVDPDNRRPVDYALRERLLGEHEALAALAAREPAALGERLQALLAEPHDGRLKLWFTWRLLQLRQRMPELFGSGGYTALAVAGGGADHVLAYAREFGGATLVVCAGRLFARLMKRDGQGLPLGQAVWGDTVVHLPMLAEGCRLEDALSGRTLAVQDGGLCIAQAFAHLPGAALVVRAAGRETGMN